MLLKWDPPVDEGGRSDTQYRIECPQCSAAVVMTPRSPVSQNSVTITNLQPGATYKMRILALNGVSGLSVAQDNFAEISAYSNSESKASIVSNFRVVEVRPTFVRLMWRPPRDQLDLKAYEVRYFVRGAKNVSQTAITKKESITISNLRDRTSYGFEVRTQTASQDWGDFGPPIFVTTGENGLIDDTNEMNNPIYQEGQEDNEQVRVAVGVVVAVIVIIAIVFALIYFIKRNSTWSKKKQQMTKDCDSLDYRGLDSHFTTTADSLPIVQTHGHGAPPIYNPFR